MTSGVATSSARLRLLLSGLAAGDALGSTSEFVDFHAVPDVYDECRPRGWPFRQVGGGCFGREPGQPTDVGEMALCLVRSHEELGRFDGADVAARFVAWMRTGRRDIGATTRAALRAVAAGAPWHEGGRGAFERRPESWSNGSLMRNGVVPGLASDLDSAFRITIQHGLITHWAPLPALCCAAQTWLIRELLAGRRPFGGPWVDELRSVFEAWLTAATDQVTARWRDTTAAHVPRAWDLLAAADFDPDRFTPLRPNLAPAGYCLLTLQIGVWAAEWALRDAPLCSLPAGLPREPFQRTGPWVLSWVAMIGRDSETYGATAGPLVAAACGGVPAELTEELRALVEP